MLTGFWFYVRTPALPVMYNNFKRLVQTDDHVVIINEMNHDARVIPLRAPPTAPTWLGNSVGRWEGDTLVIETQNFREEPGLTLASQELKVTELYLDRRQDPAIWLYGGRSKLERAMERRVPLASHQ